MLQKYAFWTFKALKITFIITSNAHQNPLKEIFYKFWGFSTVFNTKFQKLFCFLCFILSLERVIECCWCFLFTPLWQFNHIVSKSFGEKIQLKSGEHERKTNLKAEETKLKNFLLHSCHDWFFEMSFGCVEESKISFKPQ